MTTYTTATAAPFANSVFPVLYVTSESLVSRVWSTVMRFIQLELIDDRVVAEDDVSIPGWVIPAVLRLRQLESLPNNWDSYRGRPLRRKHRDAALRFLGLIMTDELERPDIVPLADGGLQLEWRRDDLEVDFISDDEVALPTLLITTSSTSHELHGIEAVTHFTHYLRPLLGSIEVAPA